MKIKIGLRFILIYSLIYLHMHSFLFSQEMAKQESESSEPANIYLNFDNATLASVVSFLGQQKKINIIPNKTLESIRVSLSTRTPLTLNKAWDVLLTLLESSQFSLIEVNGDYRIIPAANAKQQPLPIHMHAPEELPDNDLLIRYVYLFKNIRPDNVRAILDQILAPGSVQYNVNLNICVMSEKSHNIKSAMRIIKELDSGGLRESIRIIPLQEANSEYLADLINRDLVGNTTEQQNMRLMQPFGKQESTYFSKNIKAIPDPYNNTLILLGTEAGLNRIIAFIKEKLDKPIEAQESRLHIKELKYTDAEKLKPILETVIKSPTTDAKSPIVGQVKYFEDMIIAAEVASETKDDKTISVGSGNRLLIACNKEDWIRIEKFIDKLDKPQPQVAMEILFVDVHNSTDRDLGAQISTKKLNQLSTNINAETQHIAGIAPNPGNQNMINVFGTPSQPNTVTLENGAAFASAGRPNLWAIAKTALSEQNTNVLSQPYLVVRNHEKVVLEVSEKRLLDARIDSTSTTAVKKKEEVPATLAVEIIPSINSKGIITLSINIKIDEFKEATAVSGDRTNHLIQTRTTMADGQVLVIGGIIRTRTIENIYKTPILGDIPLIGNLFRRRTQTLQPSNLNVFIRPTLIKPSFEGARDDYTQLKLDYSKIQIGRQADFLENNDPIQRWFFKAEQKAADFKQIDNFNEGKTQPSAVIPALDSYYKSKTSHTSQEIQRYKRKKLAQEKGRSR